MKLTRNAYKRRIIVFGVFLFMSIALISTGFAAWVMSNDAEASTAGNVSVGLVSDSSLTITLNDTTILNGDIIQLNGFTYKFEPKADDISGRVRYDGTNSESLTLTITGTVGHHDILAVNGFTVKMDVPAGIQAAATNGYIVLPQCVSSAVPITVNTTDGTFSYEIKFEWGEKFGGDNPGIYFDEGNVADKNHADFISDADVKTELENLRAYVYNYHTDLLAPDANRADVIADHVDDDMPTFTVTFVAKAN